LGPYRKHTAGGRDDLDLATDYRLYEAPTGSLGGGEPSRYSHRRHGHRPCENGLRSSMRGQLARSTGRRPAATEGLAAQTTERPGADHRSHEHTHLL